MSPVPTFSSWAITPEQGSVLLLISGHKRQPTQVIPNQINIYCRLSCLLAEPGSFRRSSGVMATRFKIPETRTWPCPNLSPHGLYWLQPNIFAQSHKHQRLRSRATVLHPTTIDCFLWIHVSALEELQKNAGLMTFWKPSCPRGPASVSAVKLAISKRRFKTGPAPRSQSIARS